MKQRFSYLDLKIIQSELQAQILNYRLQNIYDLTTSSRHFLLKFQVPDSKKLVMVDPGFRIHVTEFSRSTAPSPSSFVTKLRKHLKTRRLNQIRLAPLNRVLVLSFSDGNLYHLVFEFFAGGNMILLDQDYKILSLQRVVSASETHSRCAVGEIYPLDEYFAQTAENSDGNSLSELKQWIGVNRVDEEGGEEDTRDQENPLQNTTEHSKGSKQKKSAKLTLKKLLYTKLPGIATGPLDAALRDNGINPDANAADFQDDSSLQSIIKAVESAQQQTEKLVSQEHVPGFILAKKNNRFDTEKHQELLRARNITPQEALSPHINSIDPHNIEYLYEEFQPFRPKVPEKDPENYKVIETLTYSQAVDIYFSTIEATKLSLRVANQEQVAEKRLNAAKAEKNKRIRSLTEVQRKSYMLGRALEDNAFLVEDAANAVRGLIQQGMDWTDMEKLIKVEKSRDNPVADIIHLPLNLSKNKISLLLPEPKEDDAESESDSDADSDSDSESESNSKQKRRVKVEIDLGLSAWANARSYFDVKKTAQAKQERTEKAADKAYVNAEKKIKRDLEQALEKERNQQTVHTIREPFWFEKFYWFVSSDGYLCLAGRDSMQNELLFRRHFKPGDIFVHCEVPGASVVIIKNHFTGTDTVPPGTLAQAGAFSIASSSKAWESKMNPSAWWARYDQVPKISPQGDIVSIDHIVVKGEKGHLPPSQMDMGLGFYWLVGEESKHLYIKEGASTSSRQSPSRQDTPEPSTEAAGEVNDDVDGDSSDEEEFPDTQIPDSEQVENNSSENASQQNEKAVEEDDRTDQADQGSEIVEEKPKPQPAEVTESTAGTDDGESLRSRSESPLTGPKRLSAKERRELRKKRKGGANATEQREEDEEKESSSSLAVKDIESALAGLKMKKDTREEQAQKPPKVRGKKGKLKKMAKYADQDEEDRRIRMELLGSTKGVEEAKAKEEEARKKKEEQERIRKELAERAKQAELKRLAAEEEEADANEGQFKFPIDTMVPKLAPGDTPIGVVPVFGPWQAISKLKYKFKMQPGTVKKGKAVKEICHALGNAKTDPNGQDPDYAWASEISMVRSMKDTDILLPIAISKMKVVIPGTNMNQPNKTKGKGKKGKR
uniref:Ribosome quality control complex subunit 2 n=1 Tax=Blastobotrys adeninivorans TaxID=409370 RepID=A0A060TCW5_BLAAD